MSDSSGRITKHDLYEKLWNGRDFEISHLWQRSIFLATFIVIVFTLYFATLEKILFEEKKTLVDVNVLIVLDGICLVGFAFSVLWICMAKGSKYWYERYEVGIQKVFENKHDLFDKDLNYQLLVDWYESVWAMGSYSYLPHHGSLPASNYNHNVLSMDGSPFSPSKINILIGYIFSASWILLSIFHNFFGSTLFSVDFTSEVISFIIVFVGMIILFLGICYLVLSGNKMSFCDFCSIVNIKENKRKEEDDNQDRWIERFLKHDSIQKQKIFDNLNEYVEHSEYKLKKIIIENIMSELPNQKYIHILRSDDNLWDIFQKSLMYREYIPPQFFGLWEAKFENKVIKIEINKEKVIFPKIFDLIYMQKTRNIELSSKKDTTRLYIDTDWEMIRRCYYKPVYYTLDFMDCNANTIHIISKDEPANPIYMTFNIDLRNNSYKRLKCTIICNEMNKTIYLEK